MKKMTPTPFLVSEPTGEEKSLKTALPCIVLFTFLYKLIESLMMTNGKIVFLKRFLFLKYNVISPNLKVLLVCCCCFVCLFFVFLWYHHNSRLLITKRSIWDRDEEAVFWDNIPGARRKERLLGFLNPNSPYFSSNYYANLLLKKQHKTNKQQQQQIL